jgi:probable F420-dependent oxidoreductase
VGFLLVEWCQFDKGHASGHNTPDSVKEIGMKYGVVFPQTEIGSDPVVIRDYVQAIEDMGYDYLLAYDHVLGAHPDRPGGWRGPYTHESSFHEPFVLYSHLAAITKRLEFVTGILVLPQRQTALVAKQAAELDILSDGRLRLGIGVGWNRVEYQGMGEDFTTRGRRSEEQVVLLRRLWDEPVIDFEGEFHTYDRVGINPLPKRQIPIWFGGWADVVMQRMARLGDGWMPNTAPPERIKPHAEQLMEYIEAAGRDPATFGIDIRLSSNIQDPGDFPALVEQYQEFGTSHVCINTMGCDYELPDGHIAVLQQFANNMDL